MHTSSLRPVSACAGVPLPSNITGCWAVPLCPMLQPAQSQIAGNGPAAAAAAVPKATQQIQHMYTWHSHSTGRASLAATKPRCCLEQAPIGQHHGQPQRLNHLRPNEIPAPLLLQARAVHDNDTQGCPPHLISGSAESSRPNSVGAATRSRPLRLCLQHTVHGPKHQCHHWLLLMPPAPFFARPVSSQ